MDKLSLIETIEQARREFDKFYRILPVSALEEPLSSGLSVKDLLAHISAWENHLIDWLTGQSESLEPIKEMGELDYRFYQLYKDWTWEEVEYQARDTFSALLDCISALSPTQLNDETAQKNIAVYTVDHYAKHQPMLERWSVVWRTRRR